MDIAKFTRPRTMGDLIVKEWDQDYDSEVGLLRSGVGAISSRTVLGMQTVGTLAAAFAALAATGNPTCGAITVAAGTELGEYDILMIDATHFDVLQPPIPPNDVPGEVIGKGVFGTVFTGGGLSFTLTAGGTACIASDVLKITVTAAAGDGKLAPVSASATDGTQNAMGIASASANSTSADARLPYKARGPLIVRAEELVWPTGATTQQIAGWVAQLAALSPPILVRASG